MDAAPCGHLFCTECWTGYMSTSVSDGPGCLTLRCPDPSCNPAVGQDMINKLASNEDQKKYSNYLHRSYVEAKHRTTKWCPAPGCEYAVDYVNGSRSYDVSCKCSYSFCWNCTEEVHRPLDCDTVAKWISKNSDESQNTQWILANSKHCPTCKRAIEKNDGCMHMTCRSPCRFQFCWLCLGPWSDHGTSTGGFYACNSYKDQGVKEESDRIRERAKRYLEKYTHYYERWEANHSSRQKALADFKNLPEKIDNIREKLDTAIESELKFIGEAWLQIIECRHVLKWTYAYGYYLPKHELGKRQLFEYLQGQAESALEKLHFCAEKEIEAYITIEEDPPWKVEKRHDKLEVLRGKFHSFHLKLDALTKATRIYFEKLVQGLENGLSDVSSEGANFSSDVDFPGENVLEMEESLDHWSCVHCNYANLESVVDCGMCNMPRAGGF